MGKEVKIGSGMGTVKLRAPGPEGVVRRMRGPGDVVKLIKDKDLKGVIPLVRGGTVAFAAPLLASGTSAVITLEGAPQSHLGIVAREKGIPCLMSYAPEDGSILAMQAMDYEGYIEATSQSLEGKKVRLDLTGDEREGFVEAYVYSIE